MTVRYFYCVLTAVNIVSIDKKITDIIITMRANGNCLQNKTTWNQTATTALSLAIDFEIHSFSKTRLTVPNRQFYGLRFLLPHTISKAVLLNSASQRLDMN
jgi:hypothetical protein